MSDSPDAAFVIYAVASLGLWGCSAWLAHKQWDKAGFIILVRGGPWGTGRGPSSAALPRAWSSPPPLPTSARCPCVQPCLVGLLLYENVTISISVSRTGEFVDVIKQGRFALDGTGACVGGAVRVLPCCWVAHKLSRARGGAGPAS